MDLIYKEETEQAPVIATPARVRKMVPPEYLAIKLSSLGKLSAPHILHFRDYSVEDAMRIGLATSENLLETLIGILNNMVYEEFDCNNLHENEVEEIMLNIYANFWGSTIEYPFPFTEEEFDNLSDGLKKKYEKDPPVVNIALPKLGNKLVPEKFKEPITIEDKENGIKIQFILPRVEHYFIAKRFISSLYKREEQLYHVLEEKLKYNSNTEDIEKHKLIDEAELLAYQVYTKEKMGVYIACKQSLSILKYGDEDLTNMPLEKRKEYYTKIPYRLWQFVSNVFEEIDFGISHDYEVLSPIDKKPTTRRFQFQLVEFIPSSKLPSDHGYSVSFGV